MKNILLISFSSILFFLLVFVGIFFWNGKDILFSIPTEEKVLALTFDDGPHPIATPLLLDTLDSMGITATFFVCGKHVKLHPEILQETHRRGHEIGNHAWEHQPLFHFSSSIPFQEIKQTNEIIQEAIGITPTLFRPPYLIQGPGANKSLGQLSLSSVGARIHGSDWADQNPQTIADKVLEDIQSGEIIVLHDGDGDALAGEEQRSRTGTVEAVSIIVKQLQKEGYRFLTISELRGLQ